MDIRINSSYFDDFSLVSKVIVNRFVETNKIKNLDINNLIESLGKNLKESSFFIESNIEDSFNLHLNEENIPEIMKVWAISQKVFIIDSTILIRSSPVFTSPKIEPYTFANQNWEDIQLVTHAKEGVRGAWFFVNPSRGSVVVKSQPGLENQLMGTVLLQSLNINVADGKIVNLGSVEGKQLSQIGKKHGLNAKNPTCYFLMNRIKGPNYSNLTSSTEHQQLVFKNLSKLGELSVYDLVLGNFDRFQLDDMGFNGGNIMFENGVLYAIDTDCIYDESRFDFIKFALKKIIQNQGNFDSKIALKLAKNLGSGVEPSEIWKEEIKKGMNKAIQNLIEFNKNIEYFKLKFVENCKKRGMEFVFPKHVEEILGHIGECYNASK